MILRGSSISTLAQAKQVGIVPSSNGDDSLVLNAVVVYSRIQSDRPCGLPFVDKGLRIISFIREATNYRGTTFPSDNPAIGTHGSIGFVKQQTVSNKRDKKLRYVLLALDPSFSNISWSIVRSMTRESNI